MAESRKLKPLKKELHLIDVYAIATGATLSSGFFLLPGLVAIQVGPSLVLSYLLAALPLLPAMFSIIELSTAMPRAGGVYFFLDRTLGPYIGTIGGLGIWLALIFKVAFALVGMGAYISLFIPNMPLKTIAILIAFFLAVLSMFGTKRSGRFQVVLVIIVVSGLVIFMLSGLSEIQFENFRGFFNVDFTSLFSTAGIVYVSYMGVTKVASLSEEVHNPERNLPLGVILATTSTILIYGIGTSVIVGLLPMSELMGDLTPVASAAGKVFGHMGVIIISLIALLAFISVANAGTLSSSRYPLAMSRDHLLPRIFRQLGKFGTPVFSIILTTILIFLILIFIDPTGMAKLASAFQLLIFMFACLAVIVMRESKIQSYDPGYKSPLYPWMQILGIIIPPIFIIEMGAVSVFFSLGLILTCSIWYILYARKRVTRTGAIYHIFERLGRQRYNGLDSELRGILKEKGLREEDPFDEIVARSLVLDLQKKYAFANIVKEVSKKLTKIIPISPEEIQTQIMEGTLIGATPVTHGVALPHFRSNKLEHPEMVLIRCKAGITVPIFNPLTHKEEDEQTVHAVFFLISPEKDPTQHLRILAQIAGRVDDDSFIDEWNNAQDEQELREALLHDERFISLCVMSGTSTSSMIEKPLSQVFIPKGCLVAMLRRKRTVIVPNGNTVLQEGDRLTIIGDPKGMDELRRQYADNIIN